MDRRHSKLERRLKTLSVAHMPSPTTDRPQHELYDMRNHGKSCWGGDLSALGINDNALILPPSVLARVSACLSPEESSLPLLLAQFDAASDPWTQRYPQSGGFVIHLLPPAPPRPRDFGKEHAAFIVKARRAAERRARHALGDDPRAWLDVAD